MRSKERIAIENFLRERGPDAEPLTSSAIAEATGVDKVKARQALSNLKRASLVDWFGELGAPGQTYRISRKVPRRRVAEELLVDRKAHIVYAKQSPEANELGRAKTVVYPKGYKHTVAEFPDQSKLPDGIARIDGPVRPGSLAFLDCPSVRDGRPVAHQRGYIGLYGKGGASDGR